MSPAMLRHLTWTRVGASVCVGLIAYGAVVALLPHHAGAGPTLMPVPRGREDDRVANLRSEELAAQQVAKQFVIACDTTDPAHPAGDLATETALAPRLVVPHDVWPALWRSEDRRTTVVLDPPGQPVAEHSDTVAVIVTGIMTVTSDSGPPAAVPVAERIALQALPDGHSAADRGASGWQVVDVEVGA